ncbi:hypothetical protein [Limnoglobus roseus]|nr:hypothetical protein [Limnoglobus roseus]
MTASTQMQAPCALLFLYEHVLARPLDQLRVVRAPLRSGCPSC